MRLLIFFLFSPLCLLGQVTLQGKIIDAKSKKIIPFATVGLLKANIGTNANEDGIFSFISNSNIQNDTLIISCIGYSTHKFSLESNITVNLVIELNEQVSILTDVVVRNKKDWTTETLNDFTNCGNNFITTSGFLTQLAQHFHVNDENALLTSIRICRMSNALLYPEKTKFRVRIYDMDTLTGSPSKDLCDQIIEVKSHNKIVNVDLEKYRIRIPTKDFFVSIEWLKIPYNESRNKVKFNGREIENITYRPSIGWTNNESSKIEVWMLDYKNIWRSMVKLNHKSSISISATIKY